MAGRGKIFFLVLPFFPFAAFSFSTQTLEKNHGLEDPPSTYFSILGIYKQERQIE
jgi:hypothetical protein